MAQKSKPQAAESAAKKPKRLPRRHRVPLDTIRDVRRALAAIINDALVGDRLTADASRLGFLMTQLVAVIRDDELESRVAEIEKHMGERQP